MTSTGPATLLARMLPAETQGVFALPDGSERPLAAPRSEEEWSETLRLAGREGWTCLVVGRGSKLGWARTPERVDLVLSTRNHAGVVAYEPGDGTLTARAGATMAELGDVVRAGGHHLSPDVPCPAGATLGGVVAAGQSGFDRLRFGPVRHNVLGLRVALGDGSITKTGGRLVKNVTGYDLHRLYCGSHGTLCVILEASLRLYAAPAAHAAVRATLPGRAAALEAARAVAALPVRPLALEARSRSPGSNGWELLVGLCGRDDVVAWEVERITAALPDARSVRGEEARREHAEARDLEREHGRWPTLVLGCRPSRLEAVLIALEGAADAVALELELVCRPAAAEAAVRARGADAPAPEQLAGVYRSLIAAGAQVRWCDAPRGLAAELEASAPDAPGLALMRGLKQSLDPGGVFPAGRCHGGL